MVNPMAQEKKKPTTKKTTKTASRKATAAKTVKKTPAKKAPARKAAAKKPNEKPEISAKKVNVFYGDKQALFDVDLEVPKSSVTALIGPSGCGKSTFLRCLNRMNDYVESCEVKGQILLEGNDIYHPSVDTVLLREKIGMVFQKPNPFPKSIYDNVIYGPKIHGKYHSKAEADAIVETSLKRAGLWEEVKDRLGAPGTSLSGGQQQRLCIARAIAVNPEVILMDEPCSALDPIATGIIEDLIKELKKKFTIVIVTHSMSQAQRVSDYTAFFHLGDLVEHGPTKQLFAKPKEKKTQDYLKGAFG